MKYREFFQKRTVKTVSFLTLAFALQACTQTLSPILESRNSTTIKTQATSSAFRADDVKLRTDAAKLRADAAKLRAETAKLRAEEIRLRQESFIARQNAALEAQRAEIEKWQQIWKDQLQKLEDERNARLGSRDGIKPATQKTLVRPDSKEITKAPAKPSAKKTKKAAGKKATGKKRVAKKAKGKSKYDRLIRKYAKANGVPIRLAHAVVRVESGYRANARGSVGEIGLMQVRLATARGMGYRGSAKGLYNPETNIKYGMKYLGKAYRLGGGSTCGAILKYNAGHGAKRMNPTSAKYCRRVKQFI